MTQHMIGWEMLAPHNIKFIFFAYGSCEIESGHIRFIHLWARCQAIDKMRLFVGEGWHLVQPGYQEYLQRQLLAHLQDSFRKWLLGRKVTTYWIYSWHLLWTEEVLPEALRVILEDIEVVLVAQPLHWLWASAIYSYTKDEIHMWGEDANNSPLCYQIRQFLPSVWSNNEISKLKGVVGKYAPSLESG